MRDPMKIVQAENEQLRHANHQLRQQLANLQQQAGGDIAKIAAECAALKNFLGAIILQHGGHLFVREETVREASSTPYLFNTKPGPDGTGVVWTLEKGAPAPEAPRVQLPQAHDRNGIILRH